jgi:hypothetical protein
LGGADRRFQLRPKRGGDVRCQTEEEKELHMLGGRLKEALATTSNQESAKQIYIKLGRVKPSIALPTLFVWPPRPRTSAISAK